MTIFGGRGRGCRRGSQWQWQAEGLAVSANLGRRHGATLASRVQLCACLAREHRATPTSGHIAICRQATCHRFSRTNSAPAVTQTRRHGAAPLRVVYEDCPVAADSKSYRVVKSPQRSGNSFRVILWSLINRYSTKYPVTTSEYFLLKLYSKVCGITQPLQITASLPATLPVSQWSDPG